MSRFEFGMVRPSVHSLASHRPPLNVPLESHCTSPTAVKPGSQTKAHTSVKPPVHMLSPPRSECSIARAAQGLASQALVSSFRCAPSTQPPHWKEPPVFSHEALAPHPPLSF